MRVEVQAKSDVSSLNDSTIRDKRPRLDLINTVNSNTINTLH